MLSSKQLRVGAKRDAPYHSPNYATPDPFGTYLHAVMILAIGLLHELIRSTARHCIVFSLIAASSLVSANSLFQIHQVTSDAVDHEWPSLNNLGHLVWSQRDVSGFWQVMRCVPVTDICDASSTQQVTSGAVNHERPVISDDGTIVWFQDATGGGLGYQVIRREPSGSESIVELSTRNSATGDQRVAGKRLGISSDGRTISHYTFFQGSNSRRRFNVSGIGELQDGSGGRGDFSGYDYPDINKELAIVYSEDFTGLGNIYRATTVAPFSRTFIDVGQFPRIADGADQEVVYIKSSRVISTIRGDVDAGSWADVNRSGAIAFEKEVSAEKQVFLAIPIVDLNVEFSKGFYPIRVNGQLVAIRETLRGLVTAKDRLGRHVAVLDAARSLGYHHFNWLQTIWRSPLLSFCQANPGDADCDGFKYRSGASLFVPRMPFRDSPPGGWEYMGTPGLPDPVADYYEFYWDEFFQEAGVRGSRPEYAERFTNYTSFLTTAAHSGALSNNEITDSRLHDDSAIAAAHGFFFSDTPADPRGTIHFTLALVGVKGDCRQPGRTIPDLSTPCPAEVINSFLYHWESTGDANGNTRISFLNPDLTGDLPGEALELRPISPNQWLAESGLTQEALAGLGISFATPVSGPALVLVADVIGQTTAAARVTLESAGLVVGAVNSQHSATIPAGLVISQTPAANFSVTPGSAVQLTVSSGPSAAIRGDFNGDGVVDQRDLGIVLAARNTIVAAGDPRDLDGDGKVTALDARVLTTLCTHARCATN